MQTLTLVHSEKSFPIGQYADALRQESIFSLPLASLEELRTDTGSLHDVLLDPSINNGRPSSSTDAWLSSESASMKSRSG